METFIVICSLILVCWVFYVKLKPEKPKPKPKQNPFEGWKVGDLVTKKIRSGYTDYITFTMLRVEAFKEDIVICSTFCSSSYISPREVNELYEKHSKPSGKMCELKEYEIGELSDFNNETFEFRKTKKRREELEAYVKAYKETV